MRHLRQGEEEEEAVREEWEVPEVISRRGARARRWMSQLRQAPASWRSRYSASTFVPVKQVLLYLLPIGAGTCLLALQVLTLLALLVQEYKY